MTTLTPEQKEAQMASMKSFDEEMPSVGIFWYDPQDSGSNICCVLAYKSVGGGKQPNAINNRANRAYFTYKAPTMLVHQTA